MDVTKDYEMHYADPEETTMILVCGRCYSPLSEPMEEPQQEELAKLTKAHNEVWCPEK